MKRREALQKTSKILKAAIVLPGVMAALQACHQEDANTLPLSVLTVIQNKLVVAIADTIIPRTDTLGASDVKVNTLIDLLLKDIFDENAKQNFLRGLDDFDTTCKMVVGKEFIKLDERERHSYLKKIDEKEMGRDYDESAPFYYIFKQLTLKVYFSSEEGVKQNLNYVPIPGRYLADIEYKDGEKIMVGNQM
ncbi:MAG: hypothetical protein ACJA2S_001713 [Cyclobacteriaceae bacterium]|jgi:hypothetical protein